YFTSSPQQLVGQSMQSLGTDLLGWTFQVLPYVEEANLYQAAMAAPNPSFPLPGIGNYMTSQKINAFQCPSRGDRGSIPDPTGRVFQMSDYAGVFQNWLNDTSINNYTYVNPTGRAGSSQSIAKDKNTTRGIVAKSGTCLGPTSPYTIQQYPGITVGKISDGT